MRQPENESRRLSYNNFRFGECVQLLFLVTGVISVSAAHTSLSMRYNISGRRRGSCSG